MLLTRKQRAVVQLARSGLGPTQIARESHLARETVSRLLSRAKKRLRLAGIDPEKVLSTDESALLDLVA